MMMQAVEEADLDAATKRRMRFFMRQYLDAAAPSNYLATNPEAIKAALESGGKSIEEGMRNLVADMEKGRISMTDETAFEVGRNIATTKGAVVYENDLIQLIQYSPLTAKVHARPLVMVPPCINKFYIMDLQPENSLVRYAVEQGHTVFMVSWRNVKPPLDKLSWDDYLEMGVITALDEARAITGADKVNALGFCIGGTLLACALAVLAKKGKKPVASLTLMTSLLEFSDVGEIRVYIDKNFVEKREKKLAKGGIVPGAELASAFSSLRANDLVWTYVVSNYLKGKQPPAFDLLYWNGDSTNLPGPMYAYYLRNTYEDNKLAQPDALEMCGVPVSLKRVDLPAFVFAAREDHIVPWKGAYESARCLGGPGEVRPRGERPHRRLDQPGFQGQAKPLGERAPRRRSRQVVRAGEGGARQLVGAVDRVAQALRGQAGRRAHEAGRREAQAPGKRPGPLRRGAGRDREVRGALRGRTRGARAKPPGGERK